MGKGQFITKDGVRGAHDIVSDMKTAAQKKVTEIASGNQGLDLAQKQLDEQKKALDTKTYLTEGAKKIEQDQIEREQAMIQQQRTYLAADAKEANRLQNVVKLFEASLDVSEENRGAARALLNEVKASDPELAAAKGPDGKDSFFASLEKGAVEPSWWDRNWRKVAYGAAVVAGVVAGALTIWTGPGAALVGGGTTAGLMAAFGLAVGTGVVAGAVTGTAIHAGLNVTGVVSEKVNLGDDLLQFGAAGGLGAFTVASIPLMAAAGSVAAAGAGGEAAIATTATTAAATTGETIAAQAAWQVPKFMVAGGRMAAVSFAGSASYESVNHFASGATWDQSLKSVGLMTALPMAGGMAGAGVRAASPYIGKVVPWLNLASKAEPAVEAAYVAPKIFTLSNGLWTVGGLGTMEGIKGMAEYAKADALGPQYSYDATNPNGIRNSTAIFGPYANTRGWDASRQIAADGSGEGTVIQTNWRNYDPGLYKTSDMTRETPRVPIGTTKSDFTRADSLTVDEEP